MRNLGRRSRCSSLAATERLQMRRCARRWSVARAGNGTGNDRTTITYHLFNFSEEQIYDLTSFLSRRALLLIFMARPSVAKPGGREHRNRSTDRPLAAAEKVFRLFLLNNFPGARVSDALKCACISLAPRSAPANFQEVAIKMSRDEINKNASLAFE